MNTIGNKLADKIREGLDGATIVRVNFGIENKTLIETGNIDIERLVFEKDVLAPKCFDLALYFVSDDKNKRNPTATQGH